jgi:hypothetical protein
MKVRVNALLNSLLQTGRTTFVVYTCLAFGNWCRKLYEKNTHVFVLNTTVFLVAKTLAFFRPLYVWVFMPHGQKTKTWCASFG